LAVTFSAPRVASTVAFVALGLNAGQFAASFTSTVVRAFTRRGLGALPPGALLSRLVTEARQLKASVELLPPILGKPIGWRLGVGIAAREVSGL
jgi:hypothetical protein